MNRRANHSGFTLLELMLATAIIAMLGLTLYACMNIGFRARTVARNQVSEMREASIVMEVLRQDFQSIPPPGQNESTLAFAMMGQATGSGSNVSSVVQFCAYGRDEDDTPLSEGLRRITLSLDNEPGAPVLVRGVQRNLLATTEQPPDEEVLARNVRAFSVRYFDGTNWVTKWDSVAMGYTIPLAVALTIELNSAPSASDTPYRLTQIIPLACGRIPDSTDEGATQ